MRPVFFTVCAWIALADAASAQNATLRRHATEHYTLFTDLSPESLPEIELRITAMAEMYADRTRGFAGRITHKFPFYLFRDARDYHAAGGPPLSAGLFDGEKLMAVAGAELTSETWRLIQHEGFHQFVHAVIQGSFPIWVNEGMAEYFGEAVFTGDGFVIGVITQQRARRIRLWIESGNTLSVQGMMTLSQDAWVGNLNPINYDQAWSMIQFLAHAQSGRYQDPLNGFIRDVSRGGAWEAAWNRNFGRGTREFERQWRDYWLGQPERPTPELHARACVATLTSFFARAFSQRQVFGTADEFFAAAKSGALRRHKDDWLPDSLLERELSRYERMGRWEVRRRGGYELVCTLPSGGEVVGTFKTDGRRVRRGSVQVSHVEK